MNPDLPAKPTSAPEHPLGAPVARWKLWLVRLAVFSVVFVVLMSVFSYMGGIVERFFIALYSD